MSIINNYNYYYTFAKEYDRPDKLRGWDRALFTQLGYQLPMAVDTKEFSDKVRLFEVTTNHVDTLMQNRTKEILLGILYTLIALTCLALLVGGFAAPFIFVSGLPGLLSILAFQYAFFGSIGYVLTTICAAERVVTEQEMQDAYGELNFADQVRTEEDLVRTDRHASQAECRFTLLALLTIFVPFLYLYHACTSVPRWKKVLEKQNERLSALVEQNNRILAENHEYYGTQFHELDNAYCAHIEDTWDRNRVHGLLQQHHESYVQELAQKVASADVLPSVLNTIVTAYL